MGDSRTSFAYDPLGEVRTMADIGTLWSPISATTTEDRARGHSEDHQAVMTYFDRAAQVAGTTFAPMPTKNSMTGGLDLRTMLTADGKQTMYDKQNEEYRKLNPAGALRALTEAPVSDGTYRYKGTKPAEVQALMLQLQQAAFLQTLASEPALYQRVVKEAENNARAKAGLMDFDNRDK